jgi:hypothetical protein
VQKYTVFFFFEIPKNRAFCYYRIGPDEHNSIFLSKMAIPNIGI